MTTRLTSDPSKMSVEECDVRDKIRTTVKQILNAVRRQDWVRARTYDNTLKGLEAHVEKIRSELPDGHMYKGKPVRL
jgi:hypothetical protein